MKGIDLPEKTEDFTADPVELFFDLAFVFAFSQLVLRLVYDPDWSGVGETALLFWLIWLPWSQFTWAANAVSGNGRPVRVFFLIATAASMPMAASTATAYDNGGIVFASSICVIMAMGIATMMLGVSDVDEHRRAAVIWGIPTVTAMLALLVGSILDDGARTVVWVLAGLIIVVAMALAGQGEWVIRAGHLAERHGLILIIALGEIIVAIGIPVVEQLGTGAGLSGSTLLALIGSGALAGILWWSYFDRVGPALEHRGEGVEGDRARGRYARDVYTIGHAVIVGGVILAAAALEEITLHPSDEVPDRFKTMLFGGLALMLVGVVACIWRAFGVLARERAVSIAAVGLVVIVAGSINGIVLLFALDLLLVAMLAVEHARIEH